MTQHVQRNIRYISLRNKELAKIKRYEQKARREGKASSTTHLLVITQNTYTGEIKAKIETKEKYASRLGELTSSFWCGERKPQEKKALEFADDQKDYEQADSIEETVISLKAF